MMTNTSLTVERPISSRPTTSICHIPRLRRLLLLVFLLVVNCAGTLEIEVSLVWNRPSCCVQVDTPTYRIHYIRTHVCPQRERSDTWPSHLSRVAVISCMATVVQGQFKSFSVRCITHRNSYTATDSVDIQNQKEKSWNCTYISLLFSLGGFSTGSSNVTAVGS